MTRSKLLLLICFTILFSCGKSDKPDILPLNKITEVEINDSIDNSTPVTTGEVIVGFFNKKDNAGDRDYYELQFANLNNSYQMIQTAVPGIDTRISFFNNSKQLLFRVDSNGVGESEKLWDYTPKSEKIYILVEAKTGSNEKVPYIINFISRKTDSFEEVEPNNSEQYAVDINPGQSKKGYISPENDNDFYKIVYVNNKIIDFSIEVETLSNLDINFMIINKTTGESKFINQSSWGGSENYLYLTSDKGEYYIRISGSSNPNNQKDPLYYLTVHELERDEENPVYYEREFNDTEKTATDLISGEEVEGVLSPGDIDWFKFDLINDSVSMDLSLSRFTGATPSLSVYDSDLNLIKNNGDARSMSIRDLEKGRYYIKLTQLEKNRSLYRLFLNVRY